MPPIFSPDNFTWTGTQILKNRHCRFGGVFVGACFIDMDLIRGFDGVNKNQMIMDLNFIS